MNRLKIKHTLLLLLLLSGNLAASGIERLNTFTSQLKSFRAAFVQTVYDADSEPLQESKGTVILQRPGRFRWDYQKPYTQLIVADGEKLWVYDSELKQVTVKNQSEALGQAPIMLLSGNRPLENQFKLKSLGPREGMEWVELVPKVKDTDFKVIYLGLDSVGLKVMELRDNFNQATQIVFEQLQLNVPTTDEQFTFTPPVGVDVIGN